MEKTTIIIRVTKQMKADVDEIAKSHRRTTSNFIRLVIENKIREKQGLEPIKYS